MALQNTDTPEQSSDIVNLLSVEENLEQEIIDIFAVGQSERLTTSEINDISGVDHSERYMTPDALCPICLGEITKTCHTNSCSHQFCFHCLKQWAAELAVCPLCKKNFTKIYYTSSVGFPRTHEIIRTLIIDRDDEYPSQAISPSYYFSDRRTEAIIRRYGMSELQVRRQVYIDNLRAVPLPDSNGDFRPFDPDIFRRSIVFYNRLHGFVHREIAAIATLLEIYATNVTETIQINCMVEIVMHGLINLQGSVQFTMVEVVLGRFTTLFLNEIFNYIYSPYDNLTEYDNTVEYIRNPNISDEVHPIIVITLDSDDDSVLEVSSGSSSNNEESNVEILRDSASIGPTSIYTELGRDQPSTSTDIHSNRYTSEIEKGQQDKIRKNQDSQAKVTTASRKRPHSESSSLSDVDTD